MPYLRVRNDTGADLDIVRIYLPDHPSEPIEFGPLGSESLSQFREVPKVYRIARVEASGPAGVVSLQPYDFVGEEPLPEGRYTYRLFVNQQRLELEIESDSS